MKTICFVIPRFYILRGHPHLGPEERMWGLSNVDRVDVHQADVCALMSALIGTPFPVNSHGIIPLEYIDGDGEKIGSDLPGPGVVYFLFQFSMTLTLH